MLKSSGNGAFFYAPELVQRKYSPPFYCEQKIKKAKCRNNFFSIYSGKSPNLIGVQMNDMDGLVLFCLLRFLTF
ncbi:hypothetical protein SAMN05216283_103213 [Sunxiuqinia elliptica]|uniref:Uncharacterized protein n=1 Tax=Sunxiuqinia elliptica TaxID=655355 RepID=A0A1I2GZP9_9BACT|nr:hypothetical protein SAMN05216283_103213 [Sunxiuqinia elliptica]